MSLHANVAKLYLVTISVYFYFITIKGESKKYQCNFSALFLIVQSPKSAFNLQAVSE